MDYGPLCSQILDVSLGVQSGQRVWVNGWDHTTGFVTHLKRECQKRKCRVVTTIQSEDSWLDSIKRGPTAWLERPSPKQRATLDQIDSYVFTLGPGHEIDWGTISPKRRHLATIWLLEQNRFAKEWRSIAAKRGIKMLGVEATLATEERAKALGMDFANYAGSMYAGCIADSRQMSKMANRVASVLRKGTICRIMSPGGTDLRFALDDRSIEKSDGIVSERDTREGRPVFLPSGGVGTTVDEDSAEGTIYYDQPIRTWKGVIRGLRLSVKGGKVVSHTGSGRVEVFREFLEAHPREAGRFAFLGFGLNPLLKPSYTQDDKVLGLIELNFGENRSRGGKNGGTGNFWGTVSSANVTIGTSRIMKIGKLII
jgi:leucyl aminopeptidase (aminopeptidase T)